MPLIRYKCFILFFYLSFIGVELRLHLYTEKNCVGKMPNFEGNFHENYYNS